MTDAPDTSTYYAIHRAMRLTSTQLHLALDGLATGDLARAKALLRWVTGFCGELHAHHTVEDDIIFPAVAERVPTYALVAAELDEGHERLDVLMTLLTTHLGRLADGMAWEPNHRAATAAALELRDLLDEHLDVEDRDVVPLLERHFSAAEYHVLDQRAKKDLDLKQAAFTCPWLLATCTPDEQRQILADAPKALHLVWLLTRNRYARLASFALGTSVGVAA